MSGFWRWLTVPLVVLCFVVSTRTVIAAEPGHGAPAAADHNDAPAKKTVPGLLPKGDLALWSLVTFLIMLAILSKFVWPPLQSGLNDRERGIRQDIADAEANRLKSEALVAEREAKLATVHEEVREMIAEARRDSERLKQEILAAAQKDAESTRQRAIADIERSRDQALTELFDFVSNNVVGATERVIGRSLNESDHDRLVKQALSEMNVRRN